MFRAAFVLTCITFLIVFSASSSVSQDADAGQLLFNNACRTCHSMKEGDNRLGPNLPVRCRTMVFQRHAECRLCLGQSNT
jgi:cytochrome c2